MSGLSFLGDPRFVALAILLAIAIVLIKLLAATYPEDDDNWRP